MTPPLDRYRDILRDQDDANAVRLISDLDAVCTVTTPPPYLRATIAQVLRERAAHGARPPRRPLFWRLGAAALLVIAGSLGGYLHVQSPRPVSAQDMLRRAAAGPAISPGSVVHQVWTSVSYQMVGSRPAVVARQHGEIWTQVDAQGHARREASRLTDSAGADDRTLRIGETLQRYTPRTRSLSIASPAPAACAVGGPEQRRADTMPLLSDRSFLLAAARSQTRNLRLAPPQTLDGVAVNVVDISRAGVDLAPGTAPAPYHVTVRLYIDARTFVIRGQDIVRIPAQGPPHPEVSLRMVRYEVLPAAVADRVFQLRVPATTRITRTSLPPLSCVLTVAQAVALPHQPALLLSGPPSRVRLVRIVLGADAGLTPNACSAPAPFVLPVVPALTYYYQAPPLPTGVPRIFCVSTSLAPVPSFLPPPLSAQALTLRIAGRRVQVHYAQLPTPGSREIATHLLWYRSADNVVALAGTAMTKDTFFGLIGALVEGRGHPASVTRLQHDLDTRRPAP